MPNGVQWVEWQEQARDEVWVERLARIHQECPGIQVHHITGNARVGVMQVGKHTEEEAQRRIKDAGERWRHQVAVQHKLQLERVIEDLAARWKIISGDDTRLEEVMDTAMQEVLRRSNSAPEQAFGLAYDMPSVLHTHTNKIQKMQIQNPTIAYRSARRVPLGPTVLGAGYLSRLSRALSNCAPPISRCRRCVTPRTTSRARRARPTAGPARNEICWSLASATQAASCRERECCLLVLNAVTSTPQWIRQPKAA